MTASADDVVALEARRWFAESWDPAISLGEWWKRFAHSGWAFPTWPEDAHGRGLTIRQASIVTKERRKAGAFGPPFGVASMMAAPTIIAFGTPEQISRFLPGIATGEDVWCQLFSEPGAGSDLAGLQTRAVRDGDGWLITGQKVWTSGAAQARWGILLARTNVDVPKHAGITYFLIDMHQPGIEIRPLREMTGDAAFNEVFLTEARVPDDQRLGDVDGGWPVAVATLGFERASLAADSGASGGGPIVGNLDLTAPVGVVAAQDTAREGLGVLTEALSMAPDAMLATIPAMFARTDDLIVRQDITRIWSALRIARITAGRAAASAKRNQGRPGPEASIGKLAVSATIRAARDLLIGVEGPHGMLVGDDAPLCGRAQELFLASPAVSIAGGSDQIQRNIIGEKVLGLPPEPRTDNDLPFRSVSALGRPGGGAA